MITNKKLFKKRIGRILVIIYYMFFMIQIVMQIPYLTFGYKMMYLCGAIIGLGVKVIIIIVYWYIFKTRYVIQDRKVKIIQFVMGFFLVMIALLAVPINISIFETFIVVSISIILINDYKISL